MSGEDVRELNWSELKAGDILWDARQKYHGIVRSAHGSGGFLVHWYKWDPAIEMPMREHIFTPGSVLKVEAPKGVLEKLDLKRYEKGGPYN